MATELDLFLICAAIAYAEAMAIGYHMNSEYVRALAYANYEAALKRGEK